MSDAATRRGKRSQRRPLGTVASPNVDGLWWVKLPYFGWSLFEVWTNCNRRMVRAIDSFHGFPLEDCEWEVWSGPVQPPVHPPSTSCSPVATNRGCRRRLGSRR